LKFGKKKIKLNLKNTGYFQSLMPTPAFRLGAICNQTTRILRPSGRFTVVHPFIIRAKALGGDVLSGPKPHPEGWGWQP